MARSTRSRSSPRRSPCPVANALDLLGDRWTLLVIRDLFSGLKRYGEFAAGREKIPTNLLAERLLRLENAGVVRRSPYQDNPPRYDYELTEAGKALGPVLQELLNWGHRYLPGTKVLAEITGNPADSPFLPAGMKLGRPRQK